MTEITSRVDKQVLLKDLFMFYHAKVNIKTERNIIPVPYIKKNDVITSEESLDFYQWSEIIKRYLDIIKEELLNGKKIELPFRMGHLQIKKMKLKKFLDIRQSFLQGKQVYIVKPNPDSYFFKLVWDRSYRICFLKFKFHWSIRPNRKFIKQAYDRCDNDYTYIHKFDNI